MSYTKSDLPAIDENCDLKIKTKEKDLGTIEASVSSVVENNSSIAYNLLIDGKNVKMLAVATKVELHKDNERTIVRDVQVV